MANSLSDRVRIAMPSMRGRGARYHGVRVALDLDHADPARAQGEQVLVEAEGGDVYAVVPGRFQDRLALARLYLFSVYLEPYHSVNLLIR